MLTMLAHFHLYASLFGKKRIKGSFFGSIIFLTDGCQVTHPSVRFFV
jgi:hypothetical protein